LETLLLLADGQEPLSLLVAEITKQGQASGLSVANLLNTLDELEREGYVDVSYVPDDWKWGSALEEPTATQREIERSRLLAVPSERVDPNVGLFYRLTDSGEQLLNGLLARRPEDDMWRIAFVPERKELTIDAANDQVAEAALERWSESNPGFRLPPTPARIERGTSFALRDGTVVSDGVRWTVRPSSAIKSEDDAR
jgi:hypothetical protein